MNFKQPLYSSNIFVRHTSTELYIHFFTFSLHFRHLKCQYFYLVFSTFFSFYQFYTKRLFSSYPFLSPQNVCFSGDNVDKTIKLSLFFSFFIFFCVDNYFFMSKSLFLNTLLNFTILCNLSHLSTKVFPIKKRSIILIFLTNNTPSFYCFSL